MAAVRILLLASLLDACDRPPEHRTPPASAAKLRYGPLMIEAGYHLQILGRASTAGRWELAAHEAKELSELFAQDIPGAASPPEAIVEVLLGRNRGFVDQTMPVLQDAVRSRDSRKLSDAYGAVVAACNGCHVSAGFEFIEIPVEPGAPIPRTDLPVP